MKSWSTTRRRRDDKDSKSSRLNTPRDKKFRECHPHSELDVALATTRKLNIEIEIWKNSQKVMSIHFQNMWNIKKNVKSQKVGVRGYPYGICCPWVRWGWGLDGLGKFFRRRRRRRRRRPPWTYCLFFFDKIAFFSPKMSSSVEIIILRGFGGRPKIRKTSISVINSGSNLGKPTMLALILKNLAIPCTKHDNKSAVMKRSYFFISAKQSFLLKQ